MAITVGATYRHPTDAAQSPRRVLGFRENQGFVGVDYAFTLNGREETLWCCIETFQSWQGGTPYRAPSRQPKTVSA